ncbi:ATP-binding protein [Ramlibacter sp.]|uniref:ATP-binding protein n=1 Tax=Ramlibacter sp. TaxID=1917967 RepID=UPI0026075BFC|nr:ATP-binding protein [Ramlibacter sp.]MDB5956394.1 two-component system sensor histidine kinase/response regulator [Ramlibacter sp.]
MSEATDISALQARLQAAQAELALVRAEFGTFSSRISHDLRGILHNIDGFAVVLEEQLAGQASERQRHYLGRISAGTRRGDSILGDLAALSAAVVAEVELVPVDVKRLVEQAIHDLASAYAGRDVQWELAGAPWPRPMADPALLRLAVDQLLANAVKFTRGREPALIRVEVTAHEERWSLAVADNGVGFDSAYAARLFSPFERLHDATEFEGNGIGLALVRTLVQRQGGEVSAQAPAAGGAIFGLTLRPAGAVSRARRTENADHHPAPPAEACGRKLRVLLVDDEAMVRMTVKLMLEREGHQVLAPADGAAALQLLVSADCAPIDLLVTDWLMPQVGGAEVIRTARQFLPGVRVMVMTGQRPDLHGQHDLSAPVDHVLAKPVRLGELRRALAAVMR